MCSGLFFSGTVNCQGLMFTVSFVFSWGAGGASGDVRCPQIDTQQLDRQIKAIMKEVIPFLTVIYVP